jgi:predicted MFS family arabinose efflux permease
MKSNVMMHSSAGLPATSTSCSNRTPAIARTLLALCFTAALTVTQGFVPASAHGGDKPVGSLNVDIMPMVTVDGATVTSIGSTDSGAMAVLAFAALIGVAATVLVKHYRSRRSTVIDGESH